MNIFLLVLGFLLRQLYPYYIYIFTLFNISLVLGISFIVIRRVHVQVHFINCNLFHVRQQVL